MNKYLTFFLFFFFLYNYGIGQEISWSKNYGTSSFDDVNCVIQTSDGGFLIGGVIDIADNDVSSHINGKDCWLLKIDANGQILWEKTIGNEFDDRIIEVIETPDGYVFVGSISGTIGQNTGNDPDYWIVKLNSLGEIQWEEKYGGSRFDIVRDIKQTADGGFIVAGISEWADFDVSDNYGLYDIWIVRLDENGELIWEKNYGGTGDDRVCSIELSNDNGFIVAGYSESDDVDVSESIGYGENNVWIFKIDDNGEIVWDRTYGGDSEDVASEMKKDESGNFLVAGASGSFNNLAGENFYVIKFDDDGNTIWEKDYGGSFYDVASSIITSNDEYFVSGRVNSGNGDVESADYGWSDFWVIKLNQGGELIWEQVYGGSEREEALLVSECSENGKFLIVGTTNSIDYDIQNNYGQTDIWCAKIADLTATSNLNAYVIDEVISISPNPSYDGDFYVKLKDNFKNVSYKAFDLLGRELIADEYKDVSSFEIRVPRYSGLIFIDICLNFNNCKTFKLVVE